MTLYLRRTPLLSGTLNIEADDTHMYVVNTLYYESDLDLFLSTRLRLSTYTVQYARITLSMILRIFHRVLH